LPNELLLLLLLGDEEEEEEKRNSSRVIVPFHPNGPGRISPFGISEWGRQLGIRFTAGAAALNDPRSYFTRGF
jgi:hypothetical protein